MTSALGKLHHAAPDASDRWAGTASPCSIQAARTARIPMWEWCTTRDAFGRSVGVCSTRQEAMNALSDALRSAGRPTRGRITPIRLIRPIYESPAYLRGGPQYEAFYDGLVIQWR